MVFDAGTNYLYNSFRCRGEDETRDTSVNLATHVMMKLMQLISKRGYNVTCDYFFVSLDVTMRLAEQKCSIVGTARQNHRELPPRCKTKQKLLETSLFNPAQAGSTVSLTSYQSKKQKLVVLMSSLHPDVKFLLLRFQRKNQRLFYFTIKRNLGLTSLIKWLGNTL